MEHLDPPARPTTRLETRTIEVVPDEERHGTPRSQFTLWFGANMQITAIVNGSLAVVFEPIPCGRSSGCSPATFSAVPSWHCIRRRGRGWGCLR
ncbi:cytosine permease [Streptomyces aureus]